MKPVTLAATSPLAALERALSRDALDPDVPHEVWRTALVGPAAEFLARPGKHLRTSIVRLGWALAGGALTALPPRLATIVEVLHAGSLIVDDVEDDSLERRGAPCLHRLVGAPLAINTGSWMYFWALSEIAELGLPPEGELAATRTAIATLARCHQGQALDIATRVSDLSRDTVPAVVASCTRLKTGTLCRFATEIGAFGAGASASDAHAIGALGEKIGNALQMLDDLGSLKARERRDKGREDLRGHRATWPWAWLAESASPAQWEARVAELQAARTDEELDSVAVSLAADVGAHGSACVTKAIASAMADLTERAGDAPIVDMVRDELERMGASYG